METKFQTSFIPKKPLPTVGGVAGGNGMSSPRPHRHIGGNLFMTIAVFLFVASLVAAGGAYIYKQYLVNVANGYKTQLAAQEKKFDIDTIANLKAESTKVVLAKQLLANHISASQIFAIISHLTDESVQFSSMDITAPTAGGDVKVDLAGSGLNFSTVAFQSDVLGHLDQYGLNRIVKNPIISDPTLNLDGTVSFKLTAMIDRNSLLYGAAASK